MNETYNVSLFKYVAGIDGLRAIAVLSVIVYHFNPMILPGGFTGVDIFFVISGYVISKSLAKNYNKTFSSFLLEFYRRRLIRIYPALLVVLVITGIISSLFVPVSWLSAKNGSTGLSAFFGLSNFFLISGADGYFSERVSFNPFVHTWSLAVEEQFYLILPVLIFFWLKMSNRTSSYSLATQHLIPGLALLSLIYSSYETSVNQQQAFYLLPSRFWELATGVVLFQLHAKHLFVPITKYQSGILALTGTFLLVLGFGLVEETSFPFAWALLPVIGTAFLIGSFVEPTCQLSIARNVFDNKVIVYIGKTSYSLYLWHWPVFTMFRWTVGLSDVVPIIIAIGVTFLLSVASYHIVESPVRKISYLKNVDSWKLVTGCICIIFLTFAFTNQVINRPWVFNQSVTYDWNNYWPETDSISSREGNRLPKTIFVIGDSHTYAYRSMLNEVSNDLGVKIISKTLPGCPFLSLRAPYPDTQYCNQFVSTTLKAIEEIAKSGDIVFFASLRTYRLGNQWGTFSNEEIEFARNSQAASENRRYAIHQAAELIAKMRSLGLHILVDTPKPVFRAPPFRCADWFNQMNPVCAPGFSVNRDYLIEHNKPILESLSILKKDFPFIQIWDPFPVLCPNDVCSAFDNDKPLYFDGDHLSSHGNQRLVQSFKSKILHILKLAI